MISRTILLAACLLGLAVLAQAGHKTCPAGCPIMQEGQLHGRNKAVRCKACPPSFYTPTRNACCVHCKDGIITKTDDTATCNLCPRDSDPKKNSSGALTCMCKSGTQANGTDPVTGVSGCTKCPAGTFNPNRTQATDACQPCPAGLVSGPGAEKCFTCPTNTTAAADQTGCVCASNFFAVPIPPKKSPKPRKVIERSFGDDVKLPVCKQCADPTANQVPNLWPTCCAAGSSWNGTACICPDGADYVGGVCTCADGAVFSAVNQTCSCADGATWVSAGKQCSCANGATWNTTTCTCPSGATWNSTATTCDCSTGTWNGTACS